MRGDEEELHAADEIGAAMTTNEPRPNARDRHRDLDIGDLVAGGRGSGTCRRPANHAAGSSASDRMTKPARPVRQP